MFRNPVNAEKDRIQSFENSLEQKNKELKNPERSTPRGILFSQIEHLKLQIALTKKSPNQLHSDATSIEKEIQELTNSDKSSPPIFCGTANIANLNNKMKNLVAIREEIAFRSNGNEEKNSKSLGLA